MCPGIGSVWLVTAASSTTMRGTDGGTTWTGTTRWGRLRDSDPFIGSVTGKAQPNFSVAFELNTP